MISKQEEKSRKELGDKLRIAREKLDFTQADVAEKTNITVNYYAMIERGEVNPSLSKVRKLLIVLKINPSKIF
ncbi:MAG TPA: helix-turn-helix transcriptional regulator [Candidatus Limnocylindrales bacterium]|nr:helix-turn-helix transcriptional regulator [Candidatus Limnocylindrales bacterium]